MQPLCTLTVASRCHIPLKNPVLFGAAESHHQTVTFSTGVRTQQFIISKRPRLQASLFDSIAVNHGGEVYAQPAREIDAKLFHTQYVKRNFG